ncbi:MAG: hypothetical protein B6D65_02895, partial [candidate division Zixibacteria bacterium 4484_93]
VDPETSKILMEQKNRYLLTNYSTTLIFLSNKGGAQSGERLLLSGYFFYSLFRRYLPGAGLWEA